MRQNVTKLIAWIAAVSMLLSMGGFTVLADQPLIPLEPAQTADGEQPPTAEQLPAEPQETMYKVTFEQPANGKLEVFRQETALVSGAEVAEQSVIRICVTPNEGYVIGQLTINGQAAALVDGTAEYTVTADTIIAAAFEANTAPKLASKTLKTNSVTATTLNLLWTPAEDDHTAAADLQYHVYVSKSNNLSSVEKCEQNGTLIASLTNEDFYSVKNLVPDTTYYFNVVVQDVQGLKTCYTAKSVKTLENAESSVLGVAVFAEKDIAEPGDQVSLYAQVYGENEPSQAVTGTISGKKSDSTSVKVVDSESLNGKTRLILTVGEDETASELTVKVTSAQNKKAAASVIVKIQQPQEDAVTGVTVYPAEKTMQKNTSFVFGAEVAGTGKYDETVVWTVEGAASPGTAIANGKLTVAEDETAATLTVKATSATAAEVFGTATVTLSDDGAAATVTGVELSPTSATVVAGGKVSFKAKVVGENGPSQEVVWALAGNAVAETTIADGILTVAEKETAATLTVTATSVADPEKSASATVTLSMEEGYQLTVKGGDGTVWSAKYAAGTVIPIVAVPPAGYGFNPENENKWITTPEADIACIDNPTEAEAKLTMPYHDLEVKADFVRIYPEEITIRAYDEEGEDRLSSATIRTKGGAIMLKATVLPSNTLQDVTWKSSDTSIATVDADGLVTARKNGEVYITATATDKDPEGNRVTERIKVTVTNQTENNNNNNQSNNNYNNNYTGGGGTQITISSNSDKHTAYMNGYPDRTFRPDANITRAEAAAIAARLSTLYDSSKTYPCNFTDTDSNAWYANVVGFVSAKGIASGDGDGTFRPDDYVTRAEFSAMMAKATGLALRGGTSFADVGEHWAKGYINALAAKGVINGYEDGTFRPDNAVTRAEAAKIANGAAGRTPSESALGTVICPFSDVSRDFWGYYDIMEAAVSYTE